MRHLVHLVVIVGPSAGLLGIAIARDKLRARARKAIIRAASVGALDPGRLGARPPRSSTRRSEIPAGSSQLGIRIAIATTAAAGLVHVAVTKEHFSEYWLLGLFFVVCASAQILWAAGAILRPSVFLLKVGLVGNAATVVLWIFTRTIGVPVGPDAWTREAVGVVDVATSVFELAAVVAIGVALRHGRQRRLPERGRLPRASKRILAKGL